MLKESLSWSQLITLTEIVLMKKNNSSPSTPSYDSLVSKGLLEIEHFLAPGYKREIEFDEWTVARLNYIDELEPERIEWIQKHDQTDEVFVLLQGKCILYIFESSDHSSMPGKMHAIDMVPNKCYNIKKGVWHTHTLSVDTQVLIIENSNTTLENSPRVKTTVEHRQEFTKYRDQQWK